MQFAGVTLIRIIGGGGSRRGPCEVLMVVTMCMGKVPCPARRLNRCTDHAISRLPPAISRSAAPGATALGAVVVSGGFRRAELGLRQSFNVSLEGCPEDQGPAATFAGMYVPRTQLTVQL